MSDSVRIPEGEVAVRLAEHFVCLPGSGGQANVAINGGSVSAHGVLGVDIVGHVTAAGWQPIDASTGRNAWTLTYGRGGSTLRVYSQAGIGDVVARVSGRRDLAECKKVPMEIRPFRPTSRQSGIVESARTALT